MHQVSLLRFLGCTADACETAAEAGGDDLFFNAQMATAINGGPVEMMRGMLRAVGPGEPPGRRARMVLSALSDRDAAARGLAANCEVATMLASRLGMGARVTDALQTAYERWDGKGYPMGLEGEAIPVESRIAVVARDVDLFSTGDRRPRDPGKEEGKGL